MKNHYGCRPAILSSSSAFKNSSYTNDPVKLINENAISNENTCLTAKEPISYNQSLGILKSDGKFSGLLDSNSKSVTYYVDDPDTHRIFTESNYTDNMFTDEPDVANASETEKEINNSGEFALKFS